MKRRIIILFIIIFTVIGITFCKNGEKKLFEKIIETEKKLLQNNISEILDKPDKEKRDKIMVLMNYSVANSTRGDSINVISKSNFSNNK